MAKAFLDAKSVSVIASAEIDRLEGERASKQEERIQSLVGTPVLKGCLWWRHIHIRTRQEAEDIFHGRGSDSWYPPVWRHEERYGGRISNMRNILNAALGAIARGDGKVMLGHDEIASITTAA